MKTKMNKYQEELKTLSKYAHEIPNVGWALINEKMKELG